MLTVLSLIALSVGCLAGTVAVASAQVLPPETTAPPPTTAALPTTTAAPTTEAPATTEGPATTAAPATTAKPKASSTTASTVPPSTTTPEQLPTLPPLPNGQIPASSETIPSKAPSGGGTAKINPFFPALSVGGFTVAFLILAIGFLWRSRGVRSMPSAST